MQTLMDLTECLLFLVLVAGEEIAFHIMEILSTDHLVECMQKTFEIVQKRLLLIYALVWRENPKLFEYLERFVNYGSYGKEILGSLKLSKRQSAGKKILACFWSNLLFSRLALLSFLFVFVAAMEN